ncbi:hypothetical protein DNTS_006243 [Danionella cerebrum]|uniref:Uncharacterized protein n=1 Tax=Danionella cerebrum TaxID=2873325 RepID=A0A553R7S1_9TELE|nr:hypothetical protein DNTS_006243 [Danionella translucida]
MFRSSILYEQAGVSRWSKYTEQASVEQNELTDEEDNNVYTERPTFRTQGTRNRKRKSFGSDLHLSGKEDLWMGNSGFKRRDNVHPQKPNKMFNSSLIKEQVPKHSVSDEEVAPQTVSFYSTINSSSTFNMQNSDFKQQLPAQSPSVSSHRIWNQSEIETSVSKWSKFLSVPIPEDQEYDCEDENTEGACFTQALKDTKEVSDEKVNNVIKTKENSAGGYQNTFCKQPPLAKLPSCNVSFNSIFCTDEDFDDTF